MKKYLVMMISAFIFFGAASNLLAERRALDKLEYKIKPGKSEVMVLEENVSSANTKKKYKWITKKHDVHFDPQTETYNYTYWNKEGEKIEIKHEQANKVKIIIKCDVEFDEKTKEYKYKYEVFNLKNSSQTLRNFIIDVDRTTILRTEPSKGWNYYSKGPRVEGSPNWSYFGSMGADIPPGKSITIIIYGNYGPVLGTAFAQGRPKNYKKPESVEIDELGVHPPNIEGVRGKTLVPGVIPEGTDPIMYWEEIQAEAEKWGWIGEGKRRSVVDKIKHRKRSENVFGIIHKENDFESFEPEIKALIKHLEKTESKRMIDKMSKEDEIKD